MAFYAYLSHGIHYPGDDFTIKNDHPVTNLGGGYNPTTGVFTCPEEGVYVFTWAIGLVTTGQVYSQLLKNGVAAGFLWTGEKNWAEASEKTVVFELAQGDTTTVKIESAENTSPILWNLRTSFSGYIIPY
ncbi:complement C1q-like protein 2 [Ylistrum balloti]|uniref:complement C1q-like protein 2 n=1 Tax=Ylistrum balloti TaxID=509963 RepID=UPI002905D7CE|nr:complement C1q-like protein 2 [Ylistrum balloti]